jgi:hypothetical protein
MCFPSGVIMAKCFEVCITIVDECMLPSFMFVCVCVCVCALAHVCVCGEMCHFISVDLDDSVF